MSVKSDTALTRLRTKAVWPEESRDSNQTVSDRRQLRNGVSDQKGKDYTPTNRRYMCRSGLAYVKGFECFRLSGTV